MDTVQPGHEHATPRGSVLTLSSPLVDGLDADRRAALVRSLVELARSGRDEDDLVDRLTGELDRLGVPQPPVVVERLVENLRGARDLVVVTDRGEVLHGDPGFDVTRQDTDVHSTEDPEDGDRPAYS